MAMSDIKSYMQQWLQTASKGNISVDYARFQDRMELRCKACNAIFRCSLPSNPTEIDWSVQDWVTKHVPGGVHDMKVLHTPVDPIPMTADFQKLPGLHPLPTVDASEKKAAILKMQMEKYKAEQEQALTKKVEWLQKTEKEKAEIAKAQDEDAKEKALQNLLNLMIKRINASISPEMKKFKSPEGTIPSKGPDVVFTGSKKLKNAVIAIGRRFR